MSKIYSLGQHFILQDQERIQKNNIQDIKCKHNFNILLKCVYKTNFLIIKICFVSRNVLVTGFRVQDSAEHPEVTSSTHFIHHPSHNRQHKMFSPRTRTSPRPRPTPTTSTRCTHFKRHRYVTVRQGLTDNDVTLCIPCLGYCSFIVY